MQVAVIGSAADRPTVEELIKAVGLRPIFVGEDEEALVDSLFRLWIALAMTGSWPSHRVPAAREVIAREE